MNLLVLFFRMGWRLMPGKAYEPFEVGGIWYVTIAKTRVIPVAPAEYEGLVKMLDPRNR